MGMERVVVTKAWIAVVTSGVLLAACGGSLQTSTPTDAAAVKSGQTAAGISTPANTSATDQSTAADSPAIKITTVGVPFKSDPKSLKAAFSDATTAFSDPSLIRIGLEDGDWYGSLPTLGVRFQRDGTHAGDVFDRWRAGLIAGALYKIVWPRFPNAFGGWAAVFTNETGAMQFEIEGNVFPPDDIDAKPVGPAAPTETAPYTRFADIDVAATAREVADRAKKFGLTATEITAYATIGDGLLIDVTAPRGVPLESLVAPNADLSRDLAPAGHWEGVMVRIRATDGHRLLISSYVDRLGAGTGWVDPEFLKAGTTP